MPIKFFSYNNHNTSVQDSQHASISHTERHDQSVSNDALNLGFKNKGFRIGHLNIQGLSSKVDQLKLLFQSGNNLIHVLGLHVSETKLNNVHPDLPFEINGFQKPFR